MTPKLSVVMPVWNGERYLSSAIESVLAQEYEDFEFIIVDDGSTDRTLEIISSYSDRRVKLLQREHGGIVDALNFGISTARADWIARQDADDISRPRRFAAQMEALAAESNLVLCYTDVALIGDQATGIKHPHFPRTKAFLALKLCYQNPIVHSTVVFQKKAFLRAGGYQPNERHAEDFALWGRMLKLGDFMGLAERLLDFRLHPQSVSKENLEKQSALAGEIALRHCRDFMTLDAESARRALAVLSSRKAASWRWFLGNCVPRLRWKSAELYSWLALQTLKRLAPRV